MIFKSFIVIFVLLFSTEVFSKQICTASYYGKGDGFHGKKTSSGQRFNAYGLSMAHRTIKNGTKVKVTNLHNGKSVIVLKNDSGPYVRGRCADLSYGAKLALNMGGLAKVQLEVLK